MTRTLKFNMTLTQVFENWKVFIMYGFRKLQAIFRNLFDKSLIQGK